MLRVHYQYPKGIESVSDEYHLVIDDKIPEAPCAAEGRGKRASEAGEGRRGKTGNEEDRHGPSVSVRRRHTASA